MVGRTLQRYRIEEEVGHGGMAVVYRGRDVSLEREVAVKVLYPHLASRREHRLRLAREAKAVARLKHPGIVEIYDFSGEDGEEAFIVTELIRGRTLRAFAGAHPFDPPELAAACVHALADALAHAHAQGIVHRDIKPENVMVREGESPAVKLMDFGIAQIIDRDDRMTMTGALMGSPAHMAPEIIDGEEADERSDVFSLGTILYWLATGTLPFEGPSPGALLKRILDGEFTDPRELRPSISDSLAQVIVDSLARDRATRIQSAALLRERLASTLQETGVDRPEELLVDFIRSPAPTSTRVRADIVRHLMKSGETAVAENRPMRALAAFGRVISIVPGTPDAGAARQAIDRLKTKTRRRKIALQAIAAASLGSIAIASSALWPESAPVDGTSPEPPLVAAPSTGNDGADVNATQESPASLEAEGEGTADGAVPAPQIPARSDKSPRSGANTIRASTREPARVTDAVTPAAPTPEKPVLGTAFITVKPFAHVSIDGRDVGTTPWEGEAPVGEHVFRLTHDCCEPLEVRARIAADRRFELREKLVPRPARLLLDVDGPSDTGIMLDDAFLAYASDARSAPLLIPMGNDDHGEPRYDRTVSLRLFRAGFRDQVVPVTVRAGQPVTVQVKLEPQG